MKRLSYTKNALIDLIELHYYISKDSHYNAEKYLNKIFELFYNIQLFSKIGIEIKNNKGKTIRQIYLDNHRIIYEIKPEEIEIITIIHTSKKFP